MTSGTPMIIEQIKAQLDRLVPVHRVVDLTTEGPASSASWHWSKLPAKTINGSRRCGSRISSEHGRSIARMRSFIFEISGSTEKLSAFVDLMEPLGLVDVSRTGVVAIARGKSAL